MSFIIDAVSSVLGIFMKSLYRALGNYGLAIIFFTLLTKVILFPINILIQKNSIKMVRMQPEINALKIKYIDDKDKFADEQLRVYKEHKYNPFLSVVPLLLQLALVMGVLGVVYSPLTYVLGISSEDVSILGSRLTDTMNITDAGNSAQIRITELLHSGASAPDGLSSGVLESIMDFELNFMGIDLGAVPRPLNDPMQIIIPLLAGLSAYILCYAQNRINILQMTAGRLNTIGTTVFMVGFSLYLVFFVPQGVGLYWICGNLFAIPVMLLINAVIPPRKYVDIEYLNEIRRQAEIKEQKYRKYRKKEKADYKRFFSASDMKIMIYAEGKGYYKYFKEIIRYLLEYSDIDIHYITSDPEDPVLEDKREHFKTYYIASDQYLIPLFMKLECDLVLLTTPDLEKYHLKRSRVRKDIEYIYMMHGIGNIYLGYRKGALDHYDTFFLQNKNAELEIRFLEQTYGTKRKRLIETGSPLVDMLRSEYDSREHHANEIPQIVIAPSWYPGNVIDLCGEKLADQLSASGFKVILRPHPQQVRNDPAFFEMLTKKYSGNKNVVIQTDFSDNSEMTSSDIMITDWSGVAYEFAFVTRRPVICVNTPRKIMNPDFDENTLVPGLTDLRSLIGKTVEVGETDNIAGIVKEMLDKKDAYKEQIENVYQKYIYGGGKSAQICALYMINSVKNKARSNSR